MGILSTKGIILTSVLVLSFSVFWIRNSEYSNNIKLAQIEQWAETNKIDVSKVNAKPFNVEFDEQEWKKLLAKLETTRYFSLLDERYVTRQDYGFDPEYARELVDYWKSKFDWRKQVEKLNRFKQFRVNINDTVIHFVHEIIDNKQPETLKIILVDGWPGSFFSFYKMLDYIRVNGNKKYNYDIIVPSIPGYGYSTPVNRIVDAVDAAQLFDALMRHLHGESVEYYVHGEDWGSVVTSKLGILYPNRVKGIHMTLVTYTAKMSDPQYLWILLLSHLTPSLVFTPDEIEKNLTSRTSIMTKLKVIFNELGYFHLQATRPDTVGHALTDSPVGLMAYVLEKYSSYSFNREHEIMGTKDGGLNKFDRDELLTLITFYWMTNSIASSMRFYKSYFDLRTSGFPKDAIAESKMHARVPCGMLFFRNELIFEPKAIARLQCPNLKRYTLEAKGLLPDQPLSLTKT